MRAANRPSRPGTHELAAQLQRVLAVGRSGRHHAGSLSQPAALVVVLHVCHFSCFTIANSNAALNPARKALPSLPVLKTAERVQSKSYFADGIQKKF